MVFKLKKFNYCFRKGPLLLAKLKKDDFGEGNCRLAVQYYFYKIHNRYFKPELILNPRAYNKTGKFIVKEGGFKKSSLKLLQRGDIIYAERKAKENKKQSRKNWIISLHSAVYMGNNKIWHATAIDGESVLWSFSKFIKYYKPIAAKRFI